MIIGLCGFIGSGKSAVAEILAQEHGYRQVGFADRLKDVVAEMFDLPRHLLEGDTAESREWREEKLEYWSDRTGRTITPRVLLQEVGTDCMRTGFYDNIWVSILREEILKNPDVKYVVSDLRFPNEAEMIRDLGGEVWRVRRGADPDWVANGSDPPESLHPSECRWREIEGLVEVPNDGAIEDLAETVESVVLKAIPDEPTSGQVRKMFSVTNKNADDRACR